MNIFVAQIKTKNFHLSGLESGGPWIKSENRYCRTNHPYMTDNKGGDEPYREQPTGLLDPVIILITITNKQIN
jgi:hypothetical protein